ncbi:DUF2637 domain-containing protein [Nonomuraea dietziae]|uniref:DUF2637 domain-containing protein n=1 Tax=Nonomuraea dietziae TaxID=65515 RepID=UPI0031DC8AED
MDVTPPSALRRIGIALAGLAVAGLTAAACVLSFDDLRALAVLGTARADLAYLYPAGFDALLVVALISVLLLRSGRLLVRAQAAVVLVLLIVAAATVNVLAAVGGLGRLPAQPVAVGRRGHAVGAAGGGAVAVAGADQTRADAPRDPRRARRYGGARHPALPRTS